jgi:hypothetical protein
MLQTRSEFSGSHYDYIEVVSTPQNSEIRCGNGVVLVRERS